MSLIHDLAECIVGDLAPADNVSKEDKANRERVWVSVALSTYMASFTNSRPFCVVDSIVTLFF